MRKSNALGVFAVVLLACFALFSCGGGSYSATQPSVDTRTASVFTVGTDASLPSVVSCQIVVTGITLYNGSTNVPVLSNPQVVDFARLRGLHQLHQLLDLNTVPAGTDSSAILSDSATGTPVMVARSAEELPLIAGRKTASRRHRFRSQMWNGGVFSCMRGFAKGGEKNPRRRSGGLLLHPDGQNFAASLLNLDGQRRA